MVEDRRNPLLEPSPLPFGLPLFALIRAEHYREALEHGMAAQRREVEAIASDASAATFENTIVAARTIRSPAAPGAPGVRECELGRRRR